jgi:hypothetical protein
MEEKIISSVFIDQKDLSTLAQSRTLNIEGDVGSVFTVNVIKINGTSKESYYDFNSKSFTEEFTSKNNLKVTLQSRSFLTPIRFALDTSGEVYRILVFASQKDNTIFSDRSHVTVREITQVGTTNVVFVFDSGKDKFAPAPFNLSLNSKYTTDPPAANVTTTGSTTSTEPVNVNINATITNADSDTHGFGLILPTDLEPYEQSSGSFINFGRINPESRIPYSIPDNAFYTEIVKKVDGAITSKNQVVFDDVDNLVVGMEIAFFSSGAVAYGATAADVSTITAIDGNTVTFNRNQTIGDNVDVTLRAYGPSLINSAFNYSIELLNFEAIGQDFSTSVRGSNTLPASSGEITFNLNGTRGISVGSRLFAQNMNTDGQNNVAQAVSQSSTAGTVALEFTGGANDIEALEVTEGSEVFITGSNRVIKISGTVVINSFPETNRNLNLDLTKFITQGRAS